MPEEQQRKGLQDRMIDFLKKCGWFCITMYAMAALLITGILVGYSLGTGIGIWPGPLKVLWGEARTIATLAAAGAAWAGVSTARKALHNWRPPIWVKTRQDAIDAVRASNKLLLNEICHFSTRRDDDPNIIQEHLKQLSANLMFLNNLLMEVQPIMSISDPTAADGFVTSLTSLLHPANPITADEELVLCVPLQRACARLYTELNDAEQKIHAHPS